MPIPVERLGEYRLLREVGRGGMGEVYEAVQESLGRRAAIKILPPALARDPEMVERFRREAAAAAAVAHPNLVAVFGAGAQDGFHYLAMEFVEGETLAEAIARSKGGLALEVVVEVGRQVARALAMAHAAGIVHRDVKPSNLILRRGGSGIVRNPPALVAPEDETIRFGGPLEGEPAIHVVLTDFGLARPMGGSDLTGSGVFVGTPAYMAPEQVAGRSIDGRADLYALGMVLYETATGSNPFRTGDLQAVVGRVLSEAPPPPRRLRPDLPAQIDHLISRLVEKDPARRVASASEVAEAFDRLASGRSIPIRIERRGPGRTWILGVAGAAVLAAIFVLTRGANEESSGREVDIDVVEPIDAAQWTRLERRFELGLWEDLRRDLDAILEADPSNVRARYLRALSTLVERCLRAARVDGSSRPVRVVPGTADFDRLSPILFHPGIDAFEARRLVLDLDAAIEGGHEVARSRFLRAACLASSGRRDEALVELDRLLAEDPRSAHLLVARGLVRCVLGELDLAREDVEAGRNADPRSPAASYAMAVVLARLGDGQSATWDSAWKARWGDLVLRVEDPDGLHTRIGAIESAFLMGQRAEAVAALEELRRERERLVSPLVRLLRITRGNERIPLLKFLHDVYREEGRPILHSLLDDADAGLEAVALRLLAQLGEDVSGRVLDAFDRLPDQRSQLACALLILGASEYARDLETLVRSTTSAPDASIYEAYGWLSGPAGLDLHRRTAATSQHYLQLSAIEFLGWYGDSGDVERLVRLLDAGSVPVAEAAARALGRLGFPEGIGPLERAYDRRRRLSIAWGIRATGAQRFGEGLEDPLADSRRDEFVSMAGFLLQLPAPELFEPSRQALGRDQGPTRMLDLAMLASTAGPDQVPSLLDLLSTARPTERRLLVRALALLGDPRARPTLERFVDTLEPGLDRVEAAWALTRCGGDSMPPETAEFLGAPLGRLDASELLARRGDRRALESLARTLERQVPRPVAYPPWSWFVEAQPPSLAFQAAEALAILGDRRGLLALPDFLLAPDPRERRQAHRTLSRVTGRAVAFDPLQPRPQLEAARDEWRRILSGG